MPRKYVFKVFTILCFSFMLALILYKSKSQYATFGKHPRIDNGAPRKRKTVTNGDKDWKRPFVILLYTRYFGRGWEDKYPVGGSSLKAQGCSHTRCAFIDDKTRIHSSDVVLFHGNDLPSPRDIRKVPRNPRQMWVFMLQENPFTTNTGSYRIGDYNGLFNWTATYSLKSEIVTPYFNVLEIDRRKVVNETITDHSKNKKRLTMAIMSNCIAFRINLIKSLKRYLPIDLYGKCKNTLNPKLPHCEENTKECDQLQSSYKFFFAIENAYCPDYVTEKFYGQALQKGLVPIVISGAKFSHPKIAPPHSFINVLDFKDAESLANYIHYLDSNSSAYNEYHRWRAFYKIERHDYSCNFCKTLWKKYNNVKKWKAKIMNLFWSGKSCTSFTDKIFQKYV